MAVSNVLQIPWAYSSERSTVVLSSQEVVYDRDLSQIYYGNGAALGGIPLASGSVVVPAISGSNGSFTYSTVSFGNLNGVSFYSSNGSIVASYNSTLNSSNVVYTSAGLNLTNISATFNSNNISLSVAPPGAMSISAGSSSAAIGSVVYTNSNGVSFGLNGSTISASVKTDYIETSQSSLFQHTSATSNITSNALNTSVSSQFLTTQNAQVVSASNGSYSFQTLVFVDGQGVSFSTNSNGINASVKTDYQSSGNYLTTARASNDAIGLNTALTANGVQWTVNSSGLSLNVPAFLTTAMGSNQGSNFVYTSQSSLFQHTSATSNITSLAFPSADTTKFAGTGTSATNASITLNSAGLAISVAAPGTTNGLISAVKYSAGTLSSNRTDITFADSNGVSFGLNTGGVITATVKTDYQTSGNYLTTARASNDAIGLNTALTANGVSMTANSSGLSLNFPAFLTTAALSGDTTKYVQNWKLTGNTAGTTSSAQGTDLWLAGGNGVTISGSSNTISFSVATDYQSQGAYLTTAMASNRGTDFVQANATFNGTNASGTIASNNISVSVAAQSVQPVAISGSNGSFSYSTVTFGALNGITFYTSNNSFVASYTVPTVTNSSFSVQDSATTLNPVARIAFSTGNNITLSLSTGASSATVGVSHRLAGTSSGFTGGASISGSMTHNSSGLAISLSHPAWLTTAMASNAVTLSNINVSAGTTSNNLSKFTLSNLNGVSFGLNGSVITASHNGVTSQSNQNISLYALGNTTQNSSTVLNASNLSFNGLGQVYAGYSNGSIQVSVPFNLVRTSSYSASASVAPNADSYDLTFVTAQNAAIELSNPTGTPVQGQILNIRVKDNGTSRALTYGTKIRAFGTALPTATTASKTLYFTLIYNATDDKWDTTWVQEV